MKHFNNLKRTTLVPALLSELIYPDTRPDKHGLVVTTNVVYMLASETPTVTDRSYNATVLSSSTKSSCLASGV